MNKNINVKEELQNEIHSVYGRSTYFISWVTEVYSKSARSLKLVMFIILIFVTGMVFNSCAGYVETEPSYIEIDRPLRPSESHIWIDGGWRWDRGSHKYVQRQGYWAKPKEGNTYVSGHWQGTPRGKKWVDGGWQKENLKKVSHNR